MLILIGFLPSVLYVYLAWLAIRTLSRYHGLLAMAAAFILLDVLYYGAVNALWFKDALTVTLDYVDVIWAFQEALDVFCVIALLIVGMRVTPHGNTDVSRRAELVYFIGFMLVYIWVSFGVFMTA